MVYAEDTRRTLKLVRHFGLDTRLVSLHAHNERERVDEVLAALEAGEDRALVTDAGTPSVSDPGAALVRAVGDAGLPVVPIPGPSAVLAALAASGFGADRFAFLGFPPRGGGARREWLQRCATLDLTVVAFESPNRVGRLLADLVEAGLGDTPACVCRELTKVYEETRRGTVTALADYYGGADVRGEVTVVIDRARGPGSDGEEPAGSAASAGIVGGAGIEAREVRVGARRLRERGTSTRDIARALERDYGLARNEAYQIALGAGEDDGAGETAAGEGGGTGAVEGERE